MKGLVQRGLESLGLVHDSDRAKRREDEAMKLINQGLLCLQLDQRGAKTAQDIEKSRLDQQDYHELVSLSEQAMKVFQRVQQRAAAAPRDPAGRSSFSNAFGFFKKAHTLRIANVPGLGGVKDISQTQVKGFLALEDSTFLQDLARSHGFDESVNTASAVLQRLPAIQNAKQVIADLHRYGISNHTLLTFLVADNLPQDRIADIDEKAKLVGLGLRLATTQLFATLVEGKLVNQMACHVCILYHDKEIRLRSSGLVTSPEAIKVPMTWYHSPILDTERADSREILKTAFPVYLAITKCICWNLLVLQPAKRHFSFMKDMQQKQVESDNAHTYWHKLSVQTYELMFKACETVESFFLKETREHDQNVAIYASLPEFMADMITTVLEKTLQKAQNMLLNWVATLSQAQVLYALENDGSFRGKNSTFLKRYIRDIKNEEGYLNLAPGNVAIEHLRPDQVDRSDLKTLLDGLPYVAAWTKDGSTGLAVIRAQLPPPKPIFGPMVMLPGAPPAKRPRKE